MTDTRPTAAKSLSEQEEDRTGPITHDEAVEIALRYNASHFRRGDREHARYTIPADPLRDDDIRLHAYIRQMRAMEADRDRLRDELEAAQKHARILELAIPITDDLEPRIDELMEALSCQQFTTVQVAQLVRDMRRRMASDWVKIGHLNTLRKELERAKGIIAVARELDDLWENWYEKPSYIAARHKLSLDLMNAVAAYDALTSPDAGQGER